MISIEDAQSTYEYEGYYKILPQINDWSNDLNRIKNGIKVSPDFVYSSETNSQWMEEKAFKAWVSAYRNSNNYKL